MHKWKLLLIIFIQLISCTNKLDKKYVLTYKEDDSYYYIITNAISYEGENCIWYNVYYDDVLLPPRKFCGEFTIKEIK